MRIQSGKLTDYINMIPFNTVGISRDMSSYIDVSMRS